MQTPAGGCLRRREDSRSTVGRCDEEAQWARSNLLSTLKRRFLDGRAIAFRSFSGCRTGCNRLRRGVSAIRPEIKHHEDAGHDQERADPFKGPAGVAQNLDCALPEI